MSITPGTYIAKRRRAGDLSIDDVARAIQTEPHVDVPARADWLRRIEADEAPISEIEIAALAKAIRLDRMILAALVRIQGGSSFPAPRLCVGCACSEWDPCVEADGFCYWVAHDRCSVCPDDEPDATPAEPIDDEADPAPHVPYEANDRASGKAAA